MRHVSVLTALTVGMSIAFTSGFYEGQRDENLITLAPTVTPATLQWVLQGQMCIKINHSYVDSP